MTSYIPDVNVWIALTYSSHVHHRTAVKWLDRVDGTLVFCRFTQVSFLRLLTHPRVMEQDVRTQTEAWDVYDAWLQDERVRFQAEPGRVEVFFRELTSGRHSRSNAWPDAYIAAFAKASGSTVVTFDRGLASVRGIDAVLLAGESEAG
jgi:toxin-antitoxin system PIN domain toxin